MLTDISLYDHQQQALDFLLNRRGVGCLFAEMGTGKSRMALAYTNFIEAQKVLIVCPISVSSVWEQEFVKVGLMMSFDTDWEERNQLISVRNLTFSPINQRSQMLDFEEEMRAFHNKPLYVLVNYESVWRSPLANVILDWKPDTIIWDEVHRLKSRTTRQSKFAHRLANVVSHRLALTGTPIANGLQDLFSIYRAVDPRVFGTRWADFASRYLVMGGYLNYQITGYRNEDEAKRLIAESSFQMSKEEANLNLPGREDIIINVQLEGAARRKYDEFRKNAIAEMEGTDEFGRPVRGVVLARIVLVTLLRLQQLTGGFVTTEDGQILDVSDEKIKICKDLVENASEQGNQVVIFCRFIHEIERLLAVLPNAEAIRGQVTKSNRDAIMARFRLGQTKVLVCQIHAASEGIDLTAANIAIFYSTGFSLLDFTQARDRLHRINQTKRVMYYHLHVRKTVDEKIYKALAAKVNIASKVVNLGYAKDLIT